MADDSAAGHSNFAVVKAVPAIERARVVSIWHERARRLGLNERERPDFSALSCRALTALLEQHRALYTHALPVMELLHQQILNTHSMVLLTDQRGLIMHTLGDGDFLEKAAQVALKPGVLWSEESKGTNAIGTALTEQRATFVQGGEHFLTVNRFLTCSCSPIRGPRGELIGALDVSGPQEGCHPHTMGLVRMSAQMIENHLFIGQFSASLRVHFHVRGELLGTLLEGIAAFDESGELLAVNDNARTMLALETTDTTTHSLSSLFGIDAHGLLSQCGPRNPVARLNLRSGEPVLARIQFHPSGARPVVPFESASRPSRPPPAHRSDETADGYSCKPTLASLDTGDPTIAAVIDKVRRVQGHNIPILILGETGTGKELLAHAIHNESERRARPFVPVDCASLPESLIESELFGYEEGAFTGARRQGSPGKILLADGGTLFLDEIGDMPLSLQTRLLRVLQERAVLPLGARRERPIDIAVICATHRDLKEMVRRGTFREDLYYRLNGLTVRLPALRERRDLEILLQRILGAQGAPVPRCKPEVLAAFRRYPWPGNIRQLTNVLRTASIMAGDSGLIDIAQLSEDFLEDLVPAAPAAAIPDTGYLRALRAAAVAAALKRNGGNVSATARELGVSRNTLYRTLRSTPST